ncbi:MAG TPA: hypothetical protein VII22_07470 [Streptosporangiaceae bacterium]
MTGAAAAARSRTTSRAAVVAGLCAIGVFVLVAAAVPLSILGRSSPVGAASGSVVFGVPCAVVGFVVAWRKPRNPLGWLMIAVGAGLVLTNDAGLYAGADYRLYHGALPLGWVAVLLQPLWAPAFLSYPLVILLFPDGRLPSRRWRWVMWSYLAVGALVPAGIYVVTVTTIVRHRIQVLANGDLAAVDHPSHRPAWLGLVVGISLVLLVVFWLAFLGRQAASYRRSSGERRQQMKWLVSGAAIFMAALTVGIVGGILYRNPPPIVQVLLNVVIVGIVALPAGIGVGILKYRLYDVDRLISRTVAYTIVTGLLLGLYAGLVLLATRVLSVHSQVAVAAATLAAVALFNPLRRRVQRAVDRRFNRARYDAELTVAAFSARLKDAVDLDSVRDDLAGVVHTALEPAHVSVWIRGGGQ